MSSDWTSLLVSFGGGVFGAAIGGNAAFIFTGVAVLAGVAIAATGGGDQFLADVAFGPVFGPHISFAGAAAALAYARWRGYTENGKDMLGLLMGLGKADVLLAGGVFGVLGYLFNAALQGWGWDPWTDTIAFTVVCSGVVARFLFGRTGVLGKVHNPGGRRWRPDEHANWLPWQQTPAQIIVIGLGMGLLSAFAAGPLGEIGGGKVLGFGIAAVSLFFMQMGGKCPVTHHIALPAAIAMILSGSVLFGGLVGVLAGLVGEFYSRLFLIHGDTYIDPPAASIATVTLLLRVCDSWGLFAAGVLP